MTIEDAIFLKLSTDSGVTAIVGAGNEMVTGKSLSIWVIKSIRIIMNTVLNLDQEINSTLPELDLETQKERLPAFIP